MKIKSMKPEITRTSSRGQIVIPRDIRKRFGIKEGSVFAVSARNNMIVLKKLDTEIKIEDVKTLKLIEEAWEDIKEGRYGSASPGKFFKELNKWKRK